MLMAGHLTDFAYCASVPEAPLDVVRRSRIIKSMYSFIETKLFTRLANDLLSDDEMRELQSALIDNPEAGNVVPGSGGVRKLRWRAPGRGKRGGYRVIYFAKLARALFGFSQFIQRT